MVVAAAARVQRSDTSRLGKFPRTGAGAVRAPATIARTGVQSYGDLKEYRPPEEVFSDASLSSLASVPVTMGHPQEGVSPRNARMHGIGHVTDMKPETRVKVDGSPHEWVRTTLIVGDGEALSDLESRADAEDPVEVSCGYSCTLEMTAGVDPVTGEHYDAIQRGIEFNHVAILPRGTKARAGADAKLRLDNKDHMKVIVIDGVEYEVGGEKHLAKLDADHKAALTAANDRADALQAKLDAASARADGLAAQVTQDALDARVEARLLLLQRAAKLLPGTYETQGKTDAQVRADAVSAALGADKIAGKSEAYIEARFDGLCDADAPAQYHNPANGGEKPIVKADIATDDNAFRAELARRAKESK